MQPDNINVQSDNIDVQSDNIDVHPDKHRRWFAHGLEFPLAWQSEQIVNLMRSTQTHELEVINSKATLVIEHTIKVRT